MLFLRADHRSGAEHVMRIIVAGGDGYTGWPTALHLSACGHDVAVADNFARRGYDNELGTGSLVPIEDLRTRVAVWREHTGKVILPFVGDLLDFEFTRRIIADFRPDAIVHFAEQRASPYSMIDRKHAVYTQTNNLVGTLNLLYAIGQLNPDIHIVKLGSMGEYGWPNIDIEEGWLDVEHKGRHDRVMYPKRASDFYHLSKIYDSHNLEFASRCWNLRATDLNQGIVYGQQTRETSLDDRLATRFDYDAVFGTVVNRLVIQAALGHPLTVYGSGTQARPLIDIRDTVRCIQLACEHPAEPGEFRVFNQMTESLTITEIAETVARCWPGEAVIEKLDNPRVESEHHYYQVVHVELEKLGLEPHLLSETLIGSMFGIARRYAYRVRPELLRPTVNWRDAASVAAY
jgi:UDP-sulfoquinovose synthase